MLTPTSVILDILAANNAKAIFFVDMLYLVRLQEVANLHPAARADFDLIRQQIVEMAERGHYVFNHLHPHWLDAVYNPQNNQWELNDASRYSFEILSIAERDYVFEKTTKLLTDILQKSSRCEPVDGFRAGGLYIQPFSIFKPCFDRYGIKYDFSVLRYAKGELHDKRSKFDFTGISKNIYRFNDAVEIEEKNGIYTEYALEFAEILSVPRLLNSLFFRVFSRIPKHRRYGNGLPSSNKIYSPARNKYTGMETFSVELLNDIKLPVYVIKARKTNYLHLLSHPKLVSPYNLKVFDRLLRKLNTTGGVEYDFKAFKPDS